jgi:hypothetical protein
MRAVHGAARHPGLRLLPDALGDERLVHHRRHPHDRGGRLAAASNIDLHLLAAFNVPVGCVAILLLSLPRRQASPVVGLAATVLSTAAEFASRSSLDLGLRAGGMERVADYPGALWILLIGLIAVLSAASRAGHHAAPRSR